MSLQGRLGNAKVGFYHGKIQNQNERDATHVGFLSGQIQVVVATTALGTGIDP
ncbi:hypothetical protein T484DRAFT_1863017 [Baffinella frigidus]|nr:hypothetical protein T484DRAFT_1863017 [Cryptophyta sp. CCMP2293]